MYAPWPKAKAGYNPVGYHVGTVWPFDNSIIAWGLRRYGFKDEAARIAAGILDAAAIFEGRLPEAFAGYDRVNSPDTRFSTRLPAALRHGRLEPRCYCCGRCSASSRSTSTSSWTRLCRTLSSTWSCWTSPAAGEGSTPSDAARSTSKDGAISTSDSGVPSAAPDLKVVDAAHRVDTPIVTHVESDGRAALLRDSSLLQPGRLLGTSRSLVPKLRRIPANSH